MTDILTSGCYSTCVICTAAYSSIYQIYKNAFLLQYVIFLLCTLVFKLELISDYSISSQATFGLGTVNSPLSSMYGESIVLVT
jgi:hypothetical protein